VLQVLNFAVVTSQPRAEAVGLFNQSARRVNRFVPTSRFPEKIIRTTMDFMKFRDGFINSTVRQVNTFS
jgi:hypothetical protein